MRIHHLNAGTMSPVGARLINGRGGLFERARLVCHTLVIETGDRLVLVDTGFGLKAVAHRELLPPRWVRNVAPRLVQAETVFEQIRALGRKPEDVRDILITHLDRDHAGGLADFPWARVHLSHTEYRAAVAGELPVPPGRYSTYQFSHGPNWMTYRDFAESWFGLPSARIDLGGDAEMRLVALPGHTLGHCGVAIRTSSGWLLHAGDSYYVRSQIATPPRSPPMLAYFRRRADSDRAQRIASSHAVSEVSRRSDVTVFCTHDPQELETMRGKG